MTPVDELPEPLPDAPTDQATRAYLRRNLLILAVTVVVFVLLVWAAKTYIGPHLERVSRYMTDTFGYPGVFVMTWLIDTFTLPAPPDVVLVFIAHPRSPLDPHIALALVSIASVLAGICAFLIARRVGRIQWIQRRLERSFDKGHALFERYGVWTVVIAGLTPIPFSIVCWLAGIYRMALLPLALACLSRIPRFIGWYYLIKLGYSL